MIHLNIRILLVSSLISFVHPQEAIDPIAYYPAFTYFENQHLPYVGSVGCKELKAVGVTDTEVNINTASLTFTSENLPTEIPAGLTYAHIEVRGTIVEDKPDSYNFHYELFIMCPKCDPSYYINDEPWTTCRTEYESIRSYNQRHGRIVPVVHGQDVTLSGYFSQVDFRGCDDRPEIVVKRVSKNNDHQVFGCDTLTKIATSNGTPSSTMGPTLRPSMSESIGISGIPAPTMAPTAYYPGCFPMGELVTVDTGELVRIEDIRVGHRVLSTSRYNVGELKYANVVSVPHPYNTVAGEYVHIVTESGADIRLTPDHLLPVENKANCERALESGSSDTILSAESVSIGDCVYTIKSTTRDGQPTLERVVSTNLVEGNGLYSIIIDNDFLVFNFNKGGILASPYNRDHDIATNFYMIFRWLYWIFPCIMQSDKMLFWHHLPVKLDIISKLLIPV